MSRRLRNEQASTLSDLLSETDDLPLDFETDEQPLPADPGVTDLLADTLEDWVPQNAEEGWTDENPLDEAAALLNAHVPHLESSNREYPIVPWQSIQYVEPLGRIPVRCDPSRERSTLVGSATIRVVLHLADARVVILPQLMDGDTITLILGTETLRDQLLIQV